MKFEVTDNLRHRFEHKTMPEPMSGCLLWIGWCSNRGYGQMRIAGRSVKAHRIAWALAGHELRDHVGILHKCDNTFCCNEHHLFEGDQTANMHDMAMKRRGTRSPYGLPYGAHRKRRRFAAHVQVNNKEYYLGSFATAEEASGVAVAFAAAKRAGKSS